MKFAEAGEDRKQAACKITVAADFKGSEIERVEFGEPSVPLRDGLIPTILFFRELTAAE